MALDPMCAQRVDEALRLARGLFEEGHGFVPLPYFTPHKESHAEAVEKILDQIIWGGGQLGDRDFVPTPEEAMYLVSAAWLHDIGMMYGIFPGERPADLVGDVSRVRGGCATSMRSALSSSSSGNGVLRVGRQMPKRDGSQTYVCFIVATIQSVHSSRLK